MFIIYLILAIPIVLLLYLFRNVIYAMIGLSLIAHGGFWAIVGIALLFLVVVRILRWLRKHTV